MQGVPDSRWPFTSRAVKQDGPWPLGFGGPVVARPVLRHWVGGRAGTRWPLPHLAGSSQGTWPVLFLHWVIYARALCCGPADAHVHLNSAHCVFRNTPPTCPRGSLALHTGICPFGLFPVALGPFQRSCLVSPELGWCGPVLLAAPTPRSCWAACALTWRVPDGGLRLPP